MTFRNVIDYRISERTWGYFSEDREHVLLVPYRQPRSELYLRAAPNDIDAAYVWCVRALRQARLGEHDPLQVLGFTASSFLSKLEAGFGKFAEGPAVYIDCLVNVLRAYAAGPSTLSLKPLARSRYYAGEKTYGSEPYDLGQLRVVCFGKNWVVTDGVVEVVVAQGPSD